MSTVLYDAPIFGPIHSRRLGISLGINLMPKDGKICSFDCVYCECGYNKDGRPSSKRPTVEEVEQMLQKKLIEMGAEGKLPDVITFAGNGEPTSHPDFLAIINNTIKLRDVYAPQCKISVLCNSSFLGKKDIFEALLKVDNNILKLDTVDPEFIRLVDRPNVPFSVERLIEQLKSFKGKLIIQSIFLKGKVDGKYIDNTLDIYVNPWLKAIKEIAPQSVMVYTIDRETPDPNLEKATKEEIDSIVERVRTLGIDASAAY